MKTSSCSTARSVVLGMALCLAGCPARLEPRFASVQHHQLAGVFADALSPSRDGNHWLVLNAPHELRMYEDFAKAPQLHGLDGGIDATGWMDGERVFLAHSEGGSTPSEPVVRVVALLDSGLRTLSVVKLPKHEPELSANMYAVSPSGRFIAVDSAVFDTQRGAWLLQRAMHASQTALEFSGDDWLLTASYHDERVRLRSLRDKTEYARFMPEEVTGATFDAASRVAFVGTRSDVYAWNVVSNELERAGVGGVQSLRLCDGGRVLAVLGDRHLWLLDTQTLKTRFKIKLQAHALDLAVDGALVAVSDDSGVVYGVDAHAGKLLASAQVMSDRILALAVHAATRRVVAASARDRISSLVVIGLPER